MINQIIQINQINQNSLLIRGQRRQGCRRAAPALPTPSACGRPSVDRDARSSHAHQPGGSVTTPAVHSFFRPPMPSPLWSCRPPPRTPCDRCSPGSLHTPSRQVCLLSALGVRLRRRRAASLGSARRLARSVASAQLGPRQRLGPRLPSGSRSSPPRLGSALRLSVCGSAAAAPPRSAPLVASRARSPRLSLALGSGAPALRPGPASRLRG